MSVICKIDGKEFKDEKSLHLALRGYGLNKEKYYHKYFPRKDLLTGEIINFKNKEQYFNNDFNDKNNMKRWLKEQPIESARDYCKQLLIKRRKDKDLIYSPSQVELRSIMSPSIIFYNKIFNDYYELCSSLKLKINLFTQIIFLINLKIN